MVYSVTFMHPKQSFAEDSGPISGCQSPTLRLHCSYWGSGRARGKKKQQKTQNEDKTENKKGREKARGREVVEKEEKLNGWNY